MRVLAALVAVAAVSIPLEAHAYCRSTTNVDFEPTDVAPCDTQGRPLFWTSRCLAMVVNSRASAKVDITTARSLLDKSLAKWAAVTCDACGAPGVPSLTADEYGTSDCTVGYLRSGTNTNVMIFYDDKWPREQGQLALTTVTFKTDTGEILDADLEIDATQNLTVNGEQDGYDLESIITHEAGHVLGLAHSQDPEAVMRPTYDTGDTSMRTLTADDQCGLCAAAPPGREAPCDPTFGTCTPGAADAGAPSPDAATPGNPEVGNKADAPGYTCSCATPGRAARIGWTVIALAVIVTRLRSGSARRSRSRDS